MRTKMSRCGPETCAFLWRFVHRHVRCASPAHSYSHSHSSPSSYSLLSLTRGFVSSSSSILQTEHGLKSPTHTHTQTQAQTQALSFEVVGSASARRTWIFTHGLLGSGRNWKTFARNFCDALSSKLQGEPVRALLVDLRCHGITAETIR